MEKQRNFTIDDFEDWFEYVYEEFPSSFADEDHEDPTFVPKTIDYVQIINKNHRMLFKYVKEKPAQKVFLKKSDGTMEPKNIKTFVKVREFDVTPTPTPTRYVAPVPTPLPKESQEKKKNRRTVGGATGDNEIEAPEPKTNDYDYNDRELEDN